MFKNKELYIPRLKSKQLITSVLLFFSWIQIQSVQKFLCKFDNYIRRNKAWAMYALIATLRFGNCIHISVV